LILPTGYVGGANYMQSGGAANYVCLPHDPVWAKYHDGLETGGEMYGAEFQTSEGRAHGGQFFFGESLQVRNL
jgi:hypothetical protein